MAVFLKIQFFGTSFLFLLLLCSVQSRLTYNQSNFILSSHSSGPDTVSSSPDAKRKLGNVNLSPPQSQTMGEIMLEMVSPALSTTHHSKHNVLGSIGSKSEVRHMDQFSSEKIAPSKVLQAASSILDQTIFEAHLLNSWSMRSKFRPPKSEIPIEIPKATHTDIPDLPSDALNSMLSERTTFPQKQSSENEGIVQSNIKPLLAILHSSVIGWPQRLDVLVTTILTLESAKVTSGAYDLLVVLDSKGVSMDKLQCNSKASSVMTPREVQGRTTLCDCEQLLLQSQIPFVIADGGGGSGGKQHMNLMRHAAVKYAHHHKYSHIVMSKSTNLLSTGIVAQLSNAVHNFELLNNDKVVIVPITTVHNEYQDSTSKTTVDNRKNIQPIRIHGEGFSIPSIFPSTPSDLLEFAQHPLNFERTAQALKASIKTMKEAKQSDSSSQSLLVTTSSNEKRELKMMGKENDDLVNACDDARWSSAFSSIFAMSTKHAMEVFDNSKMTSPSKSTNNGDTSASSRKLCDLLHDANVKFRIHVTSYAYTSHEASHPNLLNNNPAPFQHALSKHPVPPSFGLPLTRNIQAGRGADDSEDATKTTTTKQLRSRTLVVATCAGVWQRSLSLILSLEGCQRDDFDFVLAVTPRDNDTSDSFARAAGIATFVQKEAIGLTDLWNQIINYGQLHEYENVFIVNNDVLVPDGAISALVSALDSGDDLVFPTTRFGGGTLGCTLYKTAKKDKTLEEFISSPMSFARNSQKLLGILSPNPNTGNPSLRVRDDGLSSSSSLQTTNSYHIEGGLLNNKNAYGSISTGAYVAFFFGLKMSWVNANMLEDGSHRLWNNTRWKNYNQEKSLLERTLVRPKGILNAFVYHFRGSTLEPGPCKNGWLDCATWQKDHRPDMASNWFKPDE